MSQHLPRFHRNAERIADAQRLAVILVESGASVEPTPTTVARATLAGDERRLRGIPVVGRGIPGMSTESARLLRDVH